MNASKSAIFLFSAENTLLGKFDRKNQNCQFKLKFGALTNSTFQQFTSRDLKPMTFLVEISFRF